MRNSTTYKHTPKTFRRSSTKILFKWGVNMQNVEKDKRGIYHSDGFNPYNQALVEKCLYWLKTGDLDVFTQEELAKLRVLLQGDQSGAEALIVAYDSRPADYRQLFIHNVKPHVYVAMKLFKDVWKKRMQGVVGFDIDVLDRTPIALLKHNPYWKELDSMIKSSDNWPASERYYYLAKQTCHCVSEDTEVLTYNGWVGVDKYNTQDEIATYKNGVIQFEKPQSWNVYDHSGGMYLFAGEETNQLVTAEHKIVHWSNNKEHIDTAQYVYKCIKEPRVPVSGTYKGGVWSLKDWEVKLLVAIQADGSFQSNNIVRFNFAKERKIDRLLDIVKEGGLHYTFIPWNSETSSGNMVSVISVTCPRLIEIFKGRKVWDSWLLNLSTDNLRVLVDELKYWDGTYSECYLHKREEYCSSVYQNIDWMKTICHLVNKQGTIGQTRVDGNTKMGINNRRMSRVQSKMVIPYNGKVYCPTVSTGMFLIRRAGKISITHNSANYGIEAQTFRMNILEKSGGKIVISFKDAELFLQVYRGLFPEIPESNMRIQSQVEMYRTLYNMFGHPYQITDWRLDKMKEYFAWPRQSTVAEITRTAYCDLHEYIESSKKQWNLLGDCHDSYLVQCPLYDVRDCRDKMIGFMAQEFESPFDGVKFRMKSEVNVGFLWSPAKEESLLGLQELNWLN